MPATLAADKFDASSQLCQGTTLVVPQMRQNDCWALRASEKLVELAPRGRFVPGHDFSRAADATNSTRALAPEGRFPRRNVPGAPGPSHLGTWETTNPMPGAPSLRRSCFCRKGGRPRLSTAPLLTCLAALTLLAGCKPVGPNYNRPAYDAPAAYKETGATAVVQPPPAPAGGSWQPASPSDGLLRGKWWEIYQDPQLNQLEERIATENPTLRQALETYLAARDQVNAARAAFYPTLSAGAGAQRQEISANGPSYSPGKPSTYSDFTVGGHLGMKAQVHRGHVGGAGLGVGAGGFHCAADAAPEVRFPTGLTCEHEIAISSGFSRRVGGTVCGDVVALCGHSGREGGEKAGAGRADLVSCGKIPFHRLAQGLVVGGDVLFQLIELRVLVDLPPLAAQHAVRGRGWLPTAPCGSGWRRDYRSCAGFLVGGRRFVAGTVVVGTDGLATGEKDQADQTGKNMDG